MLCKVKVKAHIRSDSAFLWRMDLLQVERCRVALLRIRSARSDNMPPSQRGRQSRSSGNQGGTAERRRCKHAGVCLSAHVGGLCEAADGEKDRSRVSKTVQPPCLSSPNRDEHTDKEIKSICCISTHKTRQERRR